MDLQTLLAQEMHQLYRCDPTFHKLLNDLLHYQDGTGNYSVDRHNKKNNGFDYPKKNNTLPIKE